MLLGETRTEPGWRGRWQREAVVLLAALILVTGLSWLYTRAQAGNMDVMMSMGMIMPGMERPMLPLMAALFLTTWVVMMLAMMLPSAAPMILLYDRYIVRQRSGWLTRLPTTIFVSGYFVTWLGFGLAAFVATLLHVWLADRYPDLLEYSHYVGGAALVLAGLYQLTPLKDACLRHCRSPIGFIMHAWHPGYLGALRMGLHHGFYCVGCCWGLMVVLFVVGLMNLTWMALLALAIFLEKILPWGVLISRVSGAALIVLGLLLAFRPDLATRFMLG